MGEDTFSKSIACATATLFASSTENISDHFEKSLAQGSTAGKTSPSQKSRHEDLLSQKSHPQNDLYDAIFFQPHSVFWTFGQALGTLLDSQRKTLVFYAVDWIEIQFFPTKTYKSLHISRCVSLKEIQHKSFNPQKFPSGTLPSMIEKQKPTIIFLSWRNLIFQTLLAQEGKERQRSKNKRKIKSIQ
ncbi:hypothetical protein CEXT_669721 [Caerostris extrusa]|uniref:Uncharacterized protein n=1 Tax=Caerostris extrusa TaxID=172846 RepID=A0AAV4MWN6_CAEEX|nr:hypothetical protein CEXT_669721 [Caerostris extrusa]